jgi:hypothetical protein
MKHKILVEHKMESYVDGYCKEIYVWHIWRDDSSVKEILTQELIDGNVVNEHVEYEQEYVEYQQFGQQFGSTIKERIFWNLPEHKSEPEEPFISEKEFLV